MEASSTIISMEDELFSDIKKVKRLKGQKAKRQKGLTSLPFHLFAS